MAPTMICPAHGPVEGAQCSEPMCFEALRPYTLPPTAMCTATDCGMALPCPLHPTRGDAGDREFAAYRAANVTSCPSEDSGRGTSAIQFPWGEIAVPVEGLTIGREHTAACGADIDNYDNVSRSHARLTVHAGQLFVEDLDSTNGTTVNGVRVPAGERRALTDGDVLGFGNRLRATARTERQG